MVYSVLNFKLADDYFIIKSEQSPVSDLCHSSDDISL